MSGVVGIIAAVADERAEDAIEMTRRELGSRDPFEVVLEMAACASLIHQNPELSIQQIAAVRELVRLGVTGAEDEPEMGGSRVSGTAVCLLILEALERSLAVASDDNFEGGVLADPQIKRLLNTLDQLAADPGDASPLAMTLLLFVSVIASLKVDLFVASLTSDPKKDPASCVAEAISRIRSSIEDNHAG